MKTNVDLFPLGMNVHGSKNQHFYRNHLVFVYLSNFNQWILNSLYFQWDSTSPFKKQQLAIKVDGTLEWDSASACANWSTNQHSLTVTHLLGVNRLPTTNQNWTDGTSGNCVGWLPTWMMSRIGSAERLWDKQTISPSDDDRVEIGAWVSALAGGLARQPRNAISWTSIRTIAGISFVVVAILMSVFSLITMQH